jgi:hypothetical protein
MEERKGGTQEQQEIQQECETLTGSSSSSNMYCSSSSNAVK